MSKYQPLSAHLAASPGDEWLTSFAELERVLGFSLPKAARAGRAWWTNDVLRPHSRAWAGHGWEVSDVDHAAERVVFRRAGASMIALPEAADLEPPAEAEAPAPQPPDSAALVTPAGSIQPPALKHASDAAAHDTLLFRSLRPAALLSAGVVVAATMGAFLLRTLFLRRR